MSKKDLRKLTKAGKRRQKRIEASQISGLKYFDQLAPLLERLREVGTARDRAGNRNLLMDQYCMLVLLFLFNRVEVAPNEPRFEEIKQLLTAVEGSVFTTLSRVAEAAHLKSPSTGERTYAWRLHM